MRFLQSTFAVAETVWKRVLDRTLGIILLCGAALTFVLALTADLSPSEARVGPAVVQVFVTMLVIFIGTTEIPRDLATRNVQVFLSKSLGRGEYLFGKFAGLLVLAELIFIAYLACLAAALGIKGLLPAREFVDHLLRATLQMATVCALLVALSVALAEVAATIFGVAFCILSYGIFILPVMTRLMAPDWLQPVLLVFYYVLPNGQHYLWDPSAAEAGKFLGLLAMYSGCYCACALIAASFWFRKRDLM